MIRLGETEAADDLAGSQLGQVFLALFFRAIGMDRVHHQARLYRHGRAIAGIDPLDLAGHQAITHIIRAGAAIPVDGGAEEAELAELIHDFAVEALMPVGRYDPRHQLVLGIAARGVADQPLFLAQLRVELQRVFPLELGFGGVSGGTHRKYSRFS